MSKNNLKGLEHRSEEVQELMGAVPSWIQRWGITLVAVILMAAFLLSYFIELPVKTSIDLIPLSSAAPAGIYAPSRGELTAITVADGDNVSEGDTLALFRNADNGLTEALVSPAGGRTLFSGPVRTNAVIPGGTELFRIVADEESSLTVYYGYMPHDRASSLEIGTPVSLPDDVNGRVSYISPYPDSAGETYVEVTVKNRQLSTVDTLHASMIVSSEPILKKLVGELRRRSFYDGF